jgi:glycosyltransferase involved in cell wall biosynthesis
MKYCVIIPTYNNAKTIEGVISRTLGVTKDVIVVNDGSSDATSDLLSGFPEITVVSCPKNRGKGHALHEGFEMAVSRGFDYAITIDSDGQHFPEDIEKFIEKAIAEPGSVIIGSRQIAPGSQSKGSSFANRFSNFWFRFLTGIRLEDTQTGFRLYPLNRLRNMKFFTGKYEFELEVLVRSAWKKTNITSVPVRVFYPGKNERISHFRPFTDFVRISILNAILVLIALLYVKPFSFISYLNRENIRDFVNRHILLTRDTNTQIALAVGMGIFTGILPVWGFQLMLAIALAHIFGLSKFIASVAANISIPPMIPLILYVSYLTGCTVLDTSVKISFSSDLSMRSFEDYVLTYVIGACVLSIVMGIASGLISFVLLKVFRKKRVQPAG